MNLLSELINLIFILVLQGKIINEEAFYSWLGEFLQTSGKSYQRDIRTENGTGNLTFLITVIITRYIIRALIGQSAVGYCASKPIEKSRVF